MEYFPLTNVANLGGDVCGGRFDEWRTRLRFDNSRHYRREHVPEYVALDEAVLSLSGTPGTYLIEFPRKKWEVELAESSVSLDVSNAIAIGRHTYRIIAPHDAQFSATLEIRLTRPTVETRDEGYVISYENMKYSHRNWLEDDRSAQRVGRFDLYLKTIPQHFADTRALEGISLDGAWKYKKVESTDIEDYAAVHTDDSRWDEIDVPHTFSGDLSEWDGPVWYRKSVEVPVSWKGGKVLLRFAGIDDEPLVFVNAQQLGYNCGWWRPFQVVIGDHLNFGATNQIAILLRGRRPPGRGGGIIYSFVRDYSTVTYPDRDAPVGGIYAGRNELALVEHLGSVIFEPRIGTKFEGPLRVSFLCGSEGNPFPLTMSDESELVYRPPCLHYHDLRAGSRSVPHLDAAVGYDRDVICFEGKIDPSETEIFARVEVFPFKFAEPVKISRSRELVEIVGTETDFRICLDLPAGASERDVRIDLDEQRDDYRQSHVVLIRLARNAQGEFAFRIASGTNAEENLSWGREGDRPLALLTDQWDMEVYTWAVPMKASANIAASMRTLKQALTLDSKLAERGASGLLTDVIKYPIFWLRDAAISIPGALYAGRIAHNAAVRTAGEIYEKARENISITVVQLDGTLRGSQRQKGYWGQTSSDSSQLAVYAIYKAWLQTDDEWLREYYPTVKEYLRYSNELETLFGNASDGTIRSSDGDWYDFSYKSKYEREGASLFVNIAYLRALKYGAEMARAIGDDQNADRWGKLFESGCALLTKSIPDGGLYLDDRGYLVDTIQTISDSHPNGWNYPNDLDKVTVFAGFRTIPHCVAIFEEIIRDPELIDTVVRKIDECDVLRPFPGLVQFPWNDYMSPEGETGEYEQTPFGRRWKCLPGCHAAGGRWAYAGGLIQLGLWAAGATQLAQEARENQAGYLTLARQPARIYEDAHWSGLFRNEAGDPKDTEGFYYNWGSATPIQAMVEGQYGVLPIPGGLRINPRGCEAGDGISKVAIAGGSVSYKRMSESKFLIELDTDREGNMIFTAPGPRLPSNVRITIDSGSGSPDTQDCDTDDGQLIVAYAPEVKQIIIEW